MEIVDSSAFRNATFNYRYKTAPRPSNFLLNFLTSSLQLFPHLLRAWNITRKSCRYNLSIPKTSLFSHDLPKSKTAISSPYDCLHGSSSTGADFLQFRPKWRRNMLRQRSGMFLLHLILLKRDRKLSLDPLHSGPVYVRKMGVNYTTLMRRKVVDLAKVWVTIARTR